MFGDIVDPSIKLGNKQGYSVGPTILIEAVVIAAMVIIPLMAFEALPTPPSMMAFVAAPAAAATPASSTTAARSRQR